MPQRHEEASHEGHEGHEEQAEDLRELRILRGQHLVAFLAFAAATPCLSWRIFRTKRSTTRPHSIQEASYMAMSTIEELFEHELKDMYGAETSLLDALEQMAGESSDREIKKAFTQHRRETQGQIKRLEKIFKTLGQKPEAETCPGIEGLIKEKKAFARERPTPQLLEFFNIGAGQKAERYEITAYENLIDM